VARSRREGPLHGKTVLVTRPAERSSKLVKLLDQEGARPLVAPTIVVAQARSAALTRALQDLAAGRFAWIVLTSPSTVAMLDERLESSRNVKANVAAIGDGTAEAFRRWARREPDLKPRTYTTAGLGRAFPRGEGRVLCARADIAREGLEDALAAKGWAPTRVDAYGTRFPRSLPKEARDALRDGEVDAITFTSASTVQGFVRGGGSVAGHPKVVCIGPVTAREARDHGLKVHAVADPHTTEGLIAALARALGPRGPRTG
jgi:uroporphyrinogen III methyltransferase / synthase